MEIPQQFKSSPQAYAMYLRAQGVPPMQIAQMVMQQFGSPDQYNQQQLKNKANDEQKGNIGGVLGTIAGSVGASYLPKIFGATGAGLGQQQQKRREQQAQQQEQLAQLAQLLAPLAALQL
ncbi:hypothetical protein EBZ38_17470 [bacterium]|nr:hypothetical protein [bacterium]